MRDTAAFILDILDQCCNNYTFPMLDNGYVYPAAARLSLYRSPADWAVVIETFGFSPRSDLPDTSIFTAASRLHDRDRPEDYVSRAAYEAYLARNPHNEARHVHPLHPGRWQDEEDGEAVAPGATDVVVRNLSVPLPGLDDYPRHGITLEAAPRVKVFELCRYLAATGRGQVLATPEERRFSVLPEMTQILQLEEWHHPDVKDASERPGNSETFQQLARVLVTGDVSQYRPSRPPNTHWRHWPEGGRL